MFADQASRIVADASSSPGDEQMAVRVAEVDGLIYEAIMIWHDMASATPMRFLPMNESALATLETRGYRRADVEPGDVVGLETSVPALRFADFAILVRDDLDADVAELITSVAVETLPILESKYRHLPVERSPLRYPVEPSRMADVGVVPLHPGAARYYRSIGVELADH